MALLPVGWVPKLELLVIAAGLAYVLRPAVPKAYALGILMLAVYALDVVGGLLGQGSVTPELGFRADRLLHGDAWWTPVTAMFVHAGLAHLVGNLFILLTAGPALEDRVGERKFLVIFFAAGLAGFAAHAILAYTTTIVTPGELAVGASGAIFGVLTAFALRHPRERLPLIMLFVLWLPAIAVLGIYLVYNVALMFLDSGVAWWGHFAGFLVGMAFAYTLPRVDPRSPVGRRPRVDAEKLAPYATTPETRRIVEQVRTLSTGTPTKDDAVFADAWVDRFFSKATCPQGHAFTRSGTHATCSGGETTVEFARAAK